MASMLDEMNDLLTPAMVARVTEQTGESHSAIVKGLGAVIPAIASCTAARADDRGFVKQLADLATRTAANTDALPSATGLTSGSGADTSAPGRWLSSLFGSSLSGVADSVARYAGIRGSSAATLLSVGPPLLLTYLGRWIRRDNLSPGELGDWLREERPRLDAALPAGFSLPIGLRAPVTPKRPIDESVAPLAAYVVPEPDRGSWGVPLLLLLSALGVGGLLWWNSHQNQEQARASIEEGVSRPVGTSGTMENLQFPKGSIEDRLSAFLGSATRGSTPFEFDQIRFNTGSAALTPQSDEQLRNVAAILKAYPSASVDIQGHTDNVGNEAANMALSEARAKSVAQTLNGAGVAADRVHVEGLGSQKPIADNATESGRSENRRATLEVGIP